MVRCKRESLVALNVLAGTSERRREEVVPEEDSREGEDSQKACSKQKSTKTKDVDKEEKEIHMTSMCFPFRSPFFPHYTLSTASLALMSWVSTSCLGTSMPNLFPSLTRYPFK